MSHELFTTDQEDAPTTLLDSTMVSYISLFFSFINYLASDILL